MPEIPPPPSQSSSRPKPTGPTARFLAFVEWLGNLLPHPVSLFAIFAVLVVIISAIAHAAGLQVDDPRPGNEGQVLTTRSLLDADGIRWMSQNLVANFTGFVPLGTVLVALLGVGVAEKSGLLGAVIPEDGAFGPAAGDHARGRVRGRGEQHGQRDGLCRAHPPGDGDLPCAGATPAGGHGGRVRRRLGRLQRQPAHRHGRSLALGNHAGGRAADRPRVRGPSGRELVLHDGQHIPDHRDRLVRHGADRRAASGAIRPGDGR